MSRRQSRPGSSRPGSPLTALLRVAGLALALVSACGEGAVTGRDAGPPGDGGDGGGDAIARCEQKSGTRLQLRELIPTDGTAQPGELWDLELESACRFEDDGTGRWRCAPPTASASLAYADAQCTQMIARFFGDDEPAAYVRHSVDCAREIRPVLGPLAASPLEIFRMTAEGCASRPPSDDTYFAVGDSIEGELVAGERVLEGPGRLKLYTVVGADGSHWCGTGADMYDSELETACRPLYDNTGAIRCFPSGSSVLGGFTDEACTLAAEAAIQNQCDKPTGYARRSVDIECTSGSDSGSELVATAAPLEGLFYFSSSVDGACISYSSSFLKLGAAIANESLGAMRIEDVGSGRLRARVYVGEDEPSYGVRTGPYSDFHLAQKCEPRTAEDGRLRCIPSSGPTIDRDTFADSACTAALPVVARALSPCPAEDESFASERLEDGRWRTFALLGPREGSAYRLRNEVCTAIDTPLYDVGSPVAATTFVELNLGGE